MSENFEYKGYKGSINTSKEDNCLWGKVIGIQSLLMYQGETEQKLRENFEKLVDEYLKDCKENEIEPEIPKENTNIRTAIILQKSIAKNAESKGKKLPKYFLDSLKEGETFLKI